MGLLPYQCPESLIHWQACCRDALQLQSRQIGTLLTSQQKLVVFCTFLSAS
jgi:hypothetical protein